MNTETARKGLDHHVANDTRANETAHGGLSRFARRLASVVGLTAVAAATVLCTASPSGAAVRDGDGNADEHVYCNSATHRITITTWSNGIMSNQIGGSELFPTYLPYAVYMRMQKVVNGSTVVSTNWHQVSDGTHSVTVSSPAGQTSHWYFRWAFQQPDGSFVYRSEWARGGAPYGWYADQRGYQSLTSCRT